MLDEPHGLPAALIALAGISLGDSSRDAVLQRTCEIAKTAVPGARDVSVTMIGEPAPRTVASSGSVAVAVDQVQYDGDDGPCLEAARTEKAVVVNDIRSEDRWPDYVPAALAAGVQASLSVPLRVDDAPAGAVNIYAAERGVFDADVVSDAVVLARCAGIVLTNADAFFRAKALAAQMESAMQTRAVIEQAKGIVMAQQRCGADAAFEILVRLSQSSHRKLREVAQAVVDETSREPDGAGESE